MITEQHASTPDFFFSAESPDRHAPALHTPDSEGWRPFIVFQARGSDFFRIILRNLFFTILTLGIYAFWAKVRRRTFLWRATRILGDPLEYTGTGKELLISFLIVMGCFVVLGLGLMLLALLHPRAALVMQMGMYVGLIYAVHFALYCSIRYRLTRTRWRGIRGNLGGSAAKYALKAFAYTLAVIGTLGMLGPWCTSRLVSLQMNDTFFGNRRFFFNGPARALYFAYFVVLLASSVLVGVSALIAYFNLNIAEIVKAEPHPAAGGHMFLAAVAAYAALLIALRLVGSIYQAAFERWFFGHLSFGAMRFRSTLRAGALVKLYLGNILLLVCTLGLAYPWVRLRSLSVLLNCIDYQGDPDLERLLQDTMPAPKRGEGLLDALDIDIAV
ncbi:MAG: DUF898 domain-containing protein [Deltaproteobacteria bacterium]|jgi:uncharacterized membrane protein YjgN (DUF898 family)|nr:DUF898 domain-containing protein [Deltaproteobacteria bacterium]